MGNSILNRSVQGDAISAPARQVRLRLYNHKDQFRIQYDTHLAADYECARKLIDRKWLLGTGHQHHRGEPDGYSDFEPTGVASHAGCRAGNDCGWRPDDSQTAIVTRLVIVIGL